MQTVLSGQTNVVDLPAVTKSTGGPIVGGTVNFYLVDEDGSNANKWYRGFDQTWQVAEAVAGVGTLRSDGHWYLSLGSSVWESYKRYLLYLKESGDLHIPVGEEILVNARARIVSVIVGQGNVLSLPLVARLSGDPITAGTINFYLMDKDGSNAGKWYGSGGTWSDVETVASVASHRADGHCYSLFPSEIWTKGVRYRLYARETGNLHIPVGTDLLANTLARVTAGTQKLQLSPAVIMTAYVIEELAKMTDPSDRDEWPLYSTHLPDNKNVEVNCGVIFDTVGTQDQRSMTGEWPEHPGIQLRIRARNHATGYAKIEDVASALDEIAFGTITIGALQYRIQNVRRTSPVAYLGVEPGKRRVNFTVNFLLTIRELTG